MILDTPYRLRRILCEELDFKLADLHDDTRLSDIADSLDWMNLLSAIESDFGVRIETSTALSMENVGDLARWVARQADVHA